METVAARLTAHGKPLQVQTVELPEPGRGETVVDLAYAGVNPVDRYAAMGRVAPKAPLPRTMGTEAAGQVEGRRVMVRGYGLGTGRDGLWARRAVVPAEALIDVPDGVALQQAAAMGVAGVTAWRCVHEKATVRPDDRVLVLGAAGGVGSIIVSAVHAIGAAVWGQTGSRDKVEWVRERGADDVVVGGPDEVRDAAGGLQPTVVFDPLGGPFFGAAVEALSEKGRLVAFGTSVDPVGEVPLQMLYRKGLTVHGYAGLIESDEDLAAGVRDGLEALAGGRMEIMVGREVALEDVNEAFSLLADRAVLGKLVLDLRAGVD